MRRSCRNGSSRGEQQAGGGVAALFNIFSGGALENCAVFSLGVMPYISASIMMQLLTAVIPQLGRLAKEDGGRQKIMQITRYATIALVHVQGYLLAVSFQNPASNPMLRRDHGHDQHAWDSAGRGSWAGRSAS